MTNPIHGPLAVLVLVLGVYSVAKFLFFGLLGYDRRRSAVDRQYAGRPAPGRLGDWVLLAVATALGSALLLAHGDPIPFLGGLFVGATLIQLFFHAFRENPPAGRDAPKPDSPLKRLSYAIQDRPGRAWKEMLVMTVLIAFGAVSYLLRK